MSDYNQTAGKTTVSPGVLMTIARMAALGVAGVTEVGRPSGSRYATFRGRMSNGVRLTIHDDLVFGDVYLLIKAGVNVREVCRDVQEQVARAIQEMAGMTMARLDVHVEDIDYQGVEA